MAMGCIDCHDYVDGYNRGRVDGAVEKLENLEREILKTCKDTSCEDCTSCPIKELIRKQIADLKRKDIKIGCKYFNHKTQSCEKGYVWSCDNCMDFRII